MMMSVLIVISSINEHPFLLGLILARQRMVVGTQRTSVVEIVIGLQSVGIVENEQGWDFVELE